MVSVVIFIVYLYFLLNKTEKTIILTIIWYPSTTLYNTLYLKLIIVVAFIFLFIKEFKYKRGEYLSFPFKLPFILCLSSYIISYIIWHDSYACIYNTMFIYFVPIVFWAYFRPTEEIWCFVIRNIIIYMSIICIVGIVESIFYINPFFEIAKEINGAIPEKALTIRYGLKQAQSITVWCECFGTICGLAASSLPFMLKITAKDITQKHFLLILMLLFSVVCSGSRTALVSTAVCMIGVVYLMNSMQRVKIFIIVLVIFTIIPSIFNEIFNSIIKQDEYGGSSTGMRQDQFELSIYYARNSLIWGNGLGKTWNILEDSGLLGAESILFYTIIDRGIWGIVTLLFLYICIINHLIKQKQFLLCYIPIGFLLNKILTLTAGLDETYPLFWLIPLIKNDYYLENK